MLVLNICYIYILSVADPGEEKIQLRSPSSLALDFGPPSNEKINLGKILNCHPQPNVWSDVARSSRVSLSARVFFSFALRFILWSIEFQQRPLPGHWCELLSRTE